MADNLVVSYADTLKCAALHREKHPFLETCAHCVMWADLIRIMEEMDRERIERCRAEQLANIPEATAVVPGAQLGPSAWLFEELAIEEKR